MFYFDRNLFHYAPWLEATHFSMQYFTFYNKVSVLMKTPVIGYKLGAKL